jgi:hypothetical protein
MWRVSNTAKERGDWLTALMLLWMAEYFGWATVFSGTPQVVTGLKFVKPQVSKLPLLK